MNKQQREDQQYEVIMELFKHWLANPTLRLGQLVANASEGVDPFYVEDDALLAGLSKLRREI